MLNVRAISAPHVLVFGDEANTVECASGRVGTSDPLCRQYWDTEWAWNELVREGVLRWEACSSPSEATPIRDDLVCLWTFADTGGDTGSNTGSDTGGDTGSDIGSSGAGSAKGGVLRAVGVRTDAAAT